MFISFMTELPSYRNQSFDLFCKSMDWFLYDRDSVMKELINITSLCCCSVNILEVKFCFFKFKWKTRYGHQKSIQWKTHIIRMVLGKLPSSANSNANSKPNPDPDQGPIFLGPIFRTPIKICFTWMKKIILKVFLTECKFILTKWYFDIMKKRWYNENIFNKYEIGLIEWKYIWNLFLQHFSNHINYIQMKSMSQCNFFAWWLAIDKWNQ